MKRLYVLVLLAAGLVSANVVEGAPLESSRFETPLESFVTWAPLPEGSYRYSCRNCNYNSDTKTLSCECKDSNGNWSNRSSKSGCKSFGNNNGSLVCE